MRAENQLLHAKRTCAGGRAAGNLNLTRYGCLKLEVLSSCCRLRHGIVKNRAGGREQFLCTACISTDPQVICLYGGDIIAHQHDALVIIFFSSRDTRIEFVQSVIGRKTGCDVGKSASLLSSRPHTPNRIHCQLGFCSANPTKALRTNGIWWKNESPEKRNTMEL